LASPQAATLVVNIDYGVDGGQQKVVTRPGIGFARPYLKIDTQGFDIEVLRGAGASLPAVKALQTEASIIGLYKGMPPYMDTLRYLDERGFDITGLYPVSRDSTLRLVEFDCVMINRVTAGVTA